MIKYAMLLVLAACFVNVPAAQEDFYRRICTDSQYAYEHGYNKARAGDRMYTGWSERCVPEVRQERVDAYLAGFHAGAPQPSGGGIDIRVNGNIDVQTGGGTTACTYDADCGVGRACRPIQGGMVCMGQGARGDYCMFDGDCTSQVCDTQPNGAKYCR